MKFAADAALHKVRRRNGLLLLLMVPMPISSA